MGRKILYTLAILMFVVGLGIFTYPFVSDQFNKYLSFKNIISYGDAYYSNNAAAFTDDVFAEVEEYNARLYATGSNHISEYITKLSGTDKEAQVAGEVINHDFEYERLLSSNGSDMMGFIVIPKINVQLPIKHYTSEEVLEDSIGHVYGSSLPGGGESTHCALAGHNALSSARLFTDLPSLEVGDTFSLYIADRVLNYEVDKISTVLPDELEELSIIPGEDHVTLITCTPYGINTHRLLVRGVRIQEETGFVANEQSTQLDSIDQQIKQNASFLTLHFVPIAIAVAVILLAGIGFALYKVWSAYYY